MPESQQPLEGQNIMLTAILKGGCQSVLDVGAGDGKWGKLIRSWASRMRVNVQELVALEIWPEYVKKHRLHETYDEVLVMDLRDYRDWPNHDVIILGDVLEHIHREEALTLIGMLLAVKARTYLTIPISPCPQDGAVYGNQYETHLDQWTHEELETLGWKQLHQGPNPNGLVMIGTYQLENKGGS